MDTPNSLNSVLLDGRLIAAPSKNELGVVRFVIASNYTKATETGSVTSSFTFPIVACGRLGAMCFDTLKKGRGIRVVGRLIHEEATSDDGIPRILIMAEHIEPKPIITKEKARTS